jgi:hypothetical protein
MTDEPKPDCPRCREVLEMLRAHKTELSRAQDALEDACERVEHEGRYVHTMAMILTGQRPL